VGGGLLGLADELFAPHRHHIAHIREEAKRLPAPRAESPDRGNAEDPYLWTSDTGYAGRITIDAASPDALEDAEHAARVPDHVDRNGHEDVAPGQQIAGGEHEPCRGVLNYEGQLRQ